MPTHLVLLRNDRDNDRPALYLCQNSDLHTLCRRVGYRSQKADIFELTAAPSPSYVPWGGVQLKHQATVEPTEGFSYALNQMRFYLDEVDDPIQTEELRKEALVKIQEMFLQHIQRLKTTPPSPQVEVIDIQKGENP